MAPIVKLFRLVFWSGFIVTLGAVFAALGAVAVVSWQVYLGDYSSLKKNTILARIQEETTLFYLDETTRIGSLFENRHRKYVPIEEIPEHMINAIVAAEDKNFYHHFGIDPVAIVKAASEGLLKGGRFRRGGSTITQQTVKNLVDDWETSFARKFREMIKALQLERMYNKRQILEFYLNQFHVAGNGNGIGIAARYYFNKEVQNLSLVEAAFIAGSVKGPGKYNPFIKYTKQAKADAIMYANDRKNYVLDRMLEEKWISPADYKAAKRTDVTFNRGEFRNSELSLVDLVKSQLQKKEILDALGLKSHEELNIAGLKVYTTLDQEFQEAAQLQMRRNLSRLETILSGFAPESAEEYKPRRILFENEFVFGRVEAIEGDSPKNYSIKVTFGMPVGSIPNESLVRYAKLLDLVDGKGYEVHLNNFVKSLKVGDVLFVQILSFDKDTNHAELELHKRPKISGGLMALDKGEVRAVVSGFDTYGYNRALSAKRQPGSTFKSLVFFSAFQLGWNMMDRLENSRQMFYYQGKYYFPRPDHASPFEQASILWAGVKSENLASVSLGARLVEKLNFDQFKQLMTFMEYNPTPGEAPRDFHYRIAKKTGVSIDNEGIKAFQLINAINDMAPDLIFSGDQELLKKIKQMWWGMGYASELRKLRLNNPRFATEIGLRINLVQNNYLRMKALRNALNIDLEQLRLLLRTRTPEQVATAPDAKALLDGFRVMSAPGAKLELGYSKELPEEALPPGRTGFSLASIGGRPLALADLQAIAGDPEGSIAPKEIKLGGYLAVQLLDKLEADVESKFNEIVKTSDPYSLYSYFQHHDFRIAIGLNYVLKFSQAAGLYSKLEPVLSLPLGSSDVTIGEVAKIYQTFMTGKTHKFFADGPENQLNFIRRIEDRSGNVLFEPTLVTKQLVKEPVVAEMRELLKKVVTHGTGRRARGELYMTPQGVGQVDSPVKVRIPAYGKTGTTNDFITSYFAGSILHPVPGADNTQLDPENGYVIAAYVGYDNNKSMHRGRQRISGSSGALPLWTDFAKSILNTKVYKDAVKYGDPSQPSQRDWPVVPDNRASNIVADLSRGLILNLGAANNSEVWSATNLARTGEQFQDPYAMEEGVKSVVSLRGTQEHGVWAPERYFQLFTKDDVVTEEAKTQDVPTGDEALPPDGAGGGAAPSGEKPANDGSSGGGEEGLEDPYKD